MINRRRWMAGACCALTAGAYPVYFEPRHLEVTTNTLECGLAGRPIRLLHLTDLHASKFVSMGMIGRAIDVGLEQRPDLICVTGDFVTSHSGFDEARYVTQLRRLSGAAPAFAVLGNHDGGFRQHLQTVVMRMLADSGISLLHNKSRRLQMKGSEFSLIGVGDLWTRQVDGTAAFEDVDPALPTIVMAHNPDTKDVLEAFAWKVMLSGHTHGGQVIVPFEGPCFAPVRDRRFVAGLKRWGERQIFVSRGVGNLGGVRFDCRPEVSILKLV